MNPADPTHGPGARTLSEMMQLDFSCLKEDEAIAFVGKLIDVAGDLAQQDGLKRALAHADALDQGAISEPSRGVLEYFRGNAWAWLHDIRSARDSLLWEWEMPELENSILHLRRARLAAIAGHISGPLACQVHTNLGNHLDHIGRFVEALEHWDEALQINPSFGMARSNRAIGLRAYGAALYDTTHRFIFYNKAYHELLASKSQQLQGNASSAVEVALQELEVILPPEAKDRDVELPEHPFGDSQAEVIYRKWCLENRLFLNPLNDLGPFSIAAHDCLSAPSIVVPLGEGPMHISFLSQMKQEFMSSRFQFFKGLSSSACHYSDRGANVFDTLDQPVFSYSTERLKIAFRAAYSLLDKSAYLLNDYFKLEIREHQVTFRDIWFQGKSIERLLRSEFRESQNWALRGLFWLSKDFFEKQVDFVQAMDPDAQKLCEIRNHLEHKYLKLHDWPRRTRADNSAGCGDAPTDRLAYSLARSDFEMKTLRLFKLVRACLIYVILAIHIEEKRRSADGGDQGVIPQIPLRYLEDERRE